jgi:hypothetical protein
VNYYSDGPDRDGVQAYISRTTVLQATELQWKMKESDSGSLENAISTLKEREGYD